MSVTLPYPRATAAARRQPLSTIVTSIEGRPMDGLTPAQREHVIAQAASAASAHIAVILAGRAR